MRSADEAYTIDYEGEEAKSRTQATVSAVAKTRKAEIELVFQLEKKGDAWVAEDIVIDESFPLGSKTFTEEEIIRFGKLYDPQYFHVDPEAAKHSHFGGLIASGWHTVAVGHRKMVDALFAEEERLRGLGQEPGVSGPSPGVNTMQFKAPVRPGDTVTYTAPNGKDVTVEVLKVETYAG